ncbi:MAG: sugar ABC transporter permease [Clostridia bacterium]|nr:sugar ABC transporter permease [Clostridia bacterium]
MGEARAKSPRRTAGIIQRRNDINFYICILPWLLGFLGFTIGPMLYSLYGALSKWDVVTAPTFVGMNNFIRLLTFDELFKKSLVNTFKYVILSVPTSVLLALFLAFMLNSKHKGAGIFQVIFYFPSVSAGIAVYMVWIWLFNSELGIFNYLLSILGISGPNWLGDPRWSMPAIVIMNLTFCGSSMLIFLAGLKQIPTQYYEAATIDGASAARQFRSITLPLLSPTILFNGIMAMIGSFQIFGQALILTEGGPIQSTYVMGLFIYDYAFLYGKFGYSCAASWVQFVILMIISLFVMKASGKHVNYVM